MTADQYPVTLGYKATTSPYSASNPHKGIDYGAPSGTPVVVSGVNIGLVGSTGYSTGPHLHVDKNNGALNPSDWTKIQGKVTFAGLNGTAGNQVSIQATNGALYRFLHLSKINVAVGATIGVSMDGLLSKEDVIAIYGLAFDNPDSEANQDVIKAFTGKYYRDLVNFLRQDPTWIAHMNAVNNPPGFTKLDFEVYKKS